ncbi:MAG: Fic family protein [Candidatus Baltobacteraceae bacterium]
MGKFIEREWHGRFTTGGLSRNQKRSGTYRAYLPDPLLGREFSFKAAVAADVADAERNVSRLDHEARALANTEALARILLRAESVASSKIEGLTVSPQRLLRADIARAEGDPATDQTALEVLANVDAMSYALEGVGAEISVERISEFHRRLLAPTRLMPHAGRVRSEQNWIGGTSFNPFSAAFVPPPPEDVPTLLDDLCAFCNEDSLPAVAQAAIAHAQFETIHPFVDGNGRTGRALSHMILIRRGLITRTLPPVSLILATRVHDYVTALQSTRYEGSPDSPQAIQATDEWVGLFAAACSQAVADAELFERRVEELVAKWRARLGPMRSDASALALIDRLSTTPLVTTRGVERALDVSFNAANGAIAALVSAGILTKTRAGRRNRAFEARELVDAFTDLERQMVSADGDTTISEPVREVASRPGR